MEDDGCSLQGVVHSGVFTDERNMALIVGYPHPNSDFGGRGPADDWQQAYDPAAYRALVELEDAAEGEETIEIDDDAAIEGLTYELRYYDHVAICRDGVWTLTQLPATATASALGERGGELIVLAEYGGSAYYAATYRPEPLKSAKAAKMQSKKVWEPFEYRGPEHQQRFVTFCGHELVMAGNREAGAEVGVLSRTEDAFVWQKLGGLAQPVTAITASRTNAGRAIFVATAEAILELRGTGWQDVHRPATEIDFLAALEDGWLVAGTSAGAVLAGTGGQLEHVADVGGPIRSAVRFHDALYVTTDDNVFRCSAGPQIVAVPAIASVGAWPKIGRLTATPDRLWLAGSHYVAHSIDGAQWTPVRFR